MIHPTAIVDPKAEIGEGVEIGPYSVIEKDVVHWGRDKDWAPCGHPGGNSNREADVRSFNSPRSEKLLKPLPTGERRPPF